MAYQSPHPASEQTPACLAAQTPDVQQSGQLSCACQHRVRSDGELVCSGLHELSLLNRCLRARLTNILRGCASVIGTGWRHATGSGIVCVKTGARVSE